jgi:hypothetical protein
LLVHHSTLRRNPTCSSKNEEEITQHSVWEFWFPAAYESQRLLWTIAVSSSGRMRTEWWRSHSWQWKKEIEPYSGESGCNI